MEKTKIDDLKAAVYWVAVNYQQNFYETSSDYNKYKLDEHTYLKNYIGYGLYGPPEFEEICGDDENGIYIYKKKGAMQTIDSIYNKIVEHGTQLTDEKEVLCSILYISFYYESSLTNSDELKLHEIICNTPVFKVRKNIKTKNGIEFKNYYIDDESRVYKDWKDFLKNNNYPSCIFIIPKDGEYQADLREVWSDNSSPVWVECHINNANKKIMNAVDIASTVVNFGCVGVGIAAMFNPIAAPIAVASTVGAAVSGVWGGGRAVGELVDRGTHDQSISVANRHAIPAWLGVAGSTLGLAASSGSALLSRAIRTGTSVGKGAQFAHDAIMISNLLVNSAGVIHNSLNMVQKYRETGEVSAKDVFFLTAHMLFVCNSAVRMRLASDIIKSDQNQILKDYEDSLRSNRHKKEFRRLVRNTGSQITDEVHRNEQIIRSLTKINNKDEFFATMVQNRKIFATAGTELSFADGHVQVNGVTLVNPSTFASMSKESIINLINQSSINNPSTSTNISSSRSTFITGNMLKAGAAALKEFYVQKSVASSMPIETRTSEYSGIMNDLKDVPEKSKIFTLLLDAGLCILKKVTQEGSGYSVDDLLSDVTNFIWNYVKLNLASAIPGFSTFETQYQHFIIRFVKSTYDYVKTNKDEWVNAYRKYMDKVPMSEEDYPTEIRKTNSSSDLKKDFHIKFNDVEMIDPTEVMNLPKEVSTAVVQESLHSTGSKMVEANIPPKDFVKLCEAELNDFFSKHPTSLDFKFPDILDELKGILFDLKDFEKRNIIFYKLLIVSINITQRVTENEILKKDLLVNVINCLWIFVNMNFCQIMPHTYMFNSEYESYVINIIIAIYKYQIAEPEKWSSAFAQYRDKYCTQQENI